MRPLSVAMLSHAASSRAPTGAERSLALLAAGLAGRGHRVAVVAPGKGWVLAEELRRAGVDVFVVPSRPCWLTYWEPRPWPVVLLKALRCAWPDRSAAAMAALVRDWGAGVIHVNCLPHLRGATAARRAGLPVVWHLREILPPGPRRRFFARRLLRSGAQLVAVSEAVADWIRAEGLGDRVRVVYNGVAVPASVPAAGPAREALGLPPDGALIGFIGQLLPHKGVFVFVEAALQALLQAPTLRFLLAGDGPPGIRRSLQAALAAAPAGQASRIHLLPAQGDSGDLIAACDVVCVPTLTPDPLPRVVLEAMAAGRLVVASATGGISEMVVHEESGVLVKAGSSSELAAALAGVPLGATASSAMGAEARRAVAARFSLARHLADMESLLAKWSTTMPGGG